MAEQFCHASSSCRVDQLHRSFTARCNGTGLGPSVKVAFKDGKPTPAAEAFAKKTGVEVAKLAQVSNPKGEYLAATVTKKGRRASEVLAEALPKEIQALYWAKNMYWRGGKPE